MRKDHATFIILDLFRPVTCSPALKVDLNGRILFLKLYDRRLCPQIRKSELMPPWNNERENGYFNFVSSASGAAFVDSIELNKNSVDPTTAAQEEAFLYHECNIHYRTEVMVYRKLKQLQNLGLVPKLLATVSYTTQSTIPTLEKYFTVPGILLEYIDGYTLAGLKSTDVPVKFWPGITDAAIRTVIEVGRHGILNRDVKLQNFIVRRDLRVVQLDYAFCEFKESFESEQKWIDAKESQDEVGAVGVMMRKKIRENGGTYLYNPSALSS